MAAMRLASPLTMPITVYPDPQLQPLLGAPNRFALLVEKLTLLASLASTFDEVCPFILMPNHCTN